MKYLHIGNGVSVRLEDIIGIFDLDSATVSGTSKKFLRAAREKKILTYGDEDLPRSFLVCREKVLLSRISAQGLCQRCRDTETTYRDDGE